VQILRVAHPKIVYGQLIGSPIKDDRTMTLASYADDLWKLTTTFWQIADTRSEFWNLLRFGQHNLFYLHPSGRLPMTPYIGGQ
jgi:hypothetical protein